MPKHLKKLSEEIIHQNPWWTYKHDKYEKPNGKAGDYYYGETNGMVIIIPVLEDGCLVLTLQHRYIEDKQSIEFPGGGIKKGLSPLEAAKSELLEEVGCVAEEFIKAGVFQPANGLLNDSSHVFIAEVTEQKEPQPEESEEIEILYRRPDEVDEMIRKNEIWDGQSLSAWALVHHDFLHKNQ